MSDIVKPDVIWIEGRCYRVNDPTMEITSLQEHDTFENETPINDVDDDDGDDDDYVEVVMMDDSRFCTNLHVSKHYMGYIIGKKGAVKSRIERDTRTQIKVPKPGQAGDIVIYGQTASSVKAASRRINIIVMSSRMKQRATHFISIPMNNSIITANFEKFKEEVLKECPNLDETLFIRANKLHITMGVMCLMDNEERLLASKLLTEAKEKVILPLLQSNAPPKIKLKGLSYMNDDPKQIDVLYGLVHEVGQPTGFLQNLGDSLVDHFYKAGFMDREPGRENIKLHITLINSKYRRQAETASENPQNHGRKPRQSFDGSEILKKFSDYDFGEMVLTEIHISQRRSTGNDGYYQPTFVLSLT